MSVFHAKLCHKLYCRLMESITLTWNISVPGLSPLFLTKEVSFKLWIYQRVWVKRLHASLTCLSNWMLSLAAAAICDISSHECSIWLVWSELQPSNPTRWTALALNARSTSVSLKGVSSCGVGRAFNIRQMHEEVKKRFFKGKSILQMSVRRSEECKRTTV